MPLALICVGKLREAFYREAADEYLKRLTRLSPVEVVEVPDLPEPTHAGEALRAQVMQREGEAILGKIRPADLVVALCVDGPQLTSEDFAQALGRWETAARGRIALVIGGSLGLSPQVLARADHRLSLSKMTFPHQLARVLLLEQLYRGSKIRAGHRYHK